MTGARAANALYYGGRAGNAMKRYDHPSRGTPHRTRAVFFSVLAVLGTVAIAAPYAAGVPGGAADSQSVYRTVQVRQAQLRAAPSPLSVPLASLSYGDRVRVTGLHEGWAIVVVEGRAAPAYMYASSLSATRVAPLESAGSGAAPALAPSAPELVLAGKGFGSGGNGSGPGDGGASADGAAGGTWAAVDRMEAFAYDPNRCALFLQGGG